VIYLADCVELMRLMPAGSVDAVFADQPYRLSNGGVTIKNGRLESVDKAPGAARSAPSKRTTRSTSGG
jgi:site-specific DNA-methyltransferase (adenine-specific)